MFIVNSNNVAAGNLGIVLAAPSGQSFAAGSNQLAQLSFSPVSYSNTATLSFADSPVARSAANVSASTHLPATYQSGTMAVGGSSWPVLNIASTNGQVTLSWPSSAANFVVQTTTNLSGVWIAAGGAPVSNNPAMLLMLPAPTNTTFYRLQQQP